MLLPAGAILAQGRTEPGFDLCSVEQARGITPRSAVTHPQLPILSGGLFHAGGPGGVLTFGELLGVSPAAAPWSRTTFVLFRNVGTCPVAPADGAPSPEAPERALLALPDVEAPSAVKNLRRADLR